MFGVWANKLSEFKPNETYAVEYTEEGIRTAPLRCHVRPFFLSNSRSAVRGAALSLSDDGSIIRAHKFCTRLRTFDDNGVINVHPSTDFNLHNRHSPLCCA